MKKALKAILITLISLILAGGGAYLILRGMVSGERNTVRKVSGYNYEVEPLGFYVGRHKVSGTIYRPLKDSLNIHSTVIFCPDAHEKQLRALANRGVAAYSFFWPEELAGIVIDSITPAAAKGREQLLSKIIRKVSDQRYVGDIYIYAAGSDASLGAAVAMDTRGVSGLFLAAPDFPAKSKLPRRLERWKGRVYTLPSASPASIPDSLLKR